MPLIRHATLEDVRQLERLIEQSVLTLQAAHYTREQMEGALGTVFGVDRQLILDRTYFAIESGSEIIACGGWSRRQTLFGSDAVSGKNDHRLDPATEAARVRAFFVSPSWARRGLGSRLLQACEEAALAAGFTRLELVATLTGEGLYATHGFQPVEHFEVDLSNGGKLPVIRMTKSLTLPSV